MVRPAYHDGDGIKKGLWSEEEDEILKAHVEKNVGNLNWRLLAVSTGLRRSGKSCRLRWLNYLRPDVVRGNYTESEKDRIIKLHDELGNKWSAIAAEFPGRTDNDIKNYFYAHVEKRRKRKAALIKVGCKRKAAVTKVVRAKIPQQKQSSDHHQPKPASTTVFPTGLSAENPKNVIADFNSVADLYSPAQAQGDHWIDPYQTYFSQLNVDLPPFIGKELHACGICQNDMFTFPYSSDGGVTSCSSTTQEIFQTCFSQLKTDLRPFIGEELHDFGVCKNDMYTSLYSSDGGIITSPNSSSAELQTCFSQLNIDEGLNLVAGPYSVAEPYDQTCFSRLNTDLPPFLEEELHDFGVYSSSNGGICSCNSSTADFQTCFSQLNRDLPPFPEEAGFNWVADSYSVAQPYDQTCFSRLNIDLPPFLEEGLHDFGVWQNDTSIFSHSSSDGGITSPNSSTADFQENFWFEQPEEDRFHMVFW